MTRMLTTVFEVEYYKPSGKLYTTEQVKLVVEFIGEGDCPIVPYMNDAVKWIEQQKATGTLPGLLSGKWDGPIRMNHPLGFPVLIL